MVNFMNETKGYTHITNENENCNLQCNKISAFYKHLRTIIPDITLKKNNHFTACYLDIKLQYMKQIMIKVITIVNKVIIIEH
jgi:hypothetical protein